jgi:hypothetical protein
MKPNIFDISTKELSQDAFLTWLLKWADSKNGATDKNLHECGKDFIKALIKTQVPGFDEEIEIVDAGRQWDNIDVWAKVNNKYLIIIEDKTNTGQHSGQLERYKSFAEDWCAAQSRKYHPPICIYLKTGNENKQSLGYVEQEGFKIYNRQDFLELLERHESKNDIYNDFKERLIRIERLNHEWEGKIIEQWQGNDWQGFFQYLENENLLISWAFVNNPKRGFWNAVLTWDYLDTYPVYLQAEEEKLCFKISTDPKHGQIPEVLNQRAVRNAVSDLIINSAQQQEVPGVRRPNRFGTGKYMTLAVVDSENWLVNTNGKIEKKR